MVDAIKNSDTSGSHSEAGACSTTTADTIQLVCILVGSCDEEKAKCGEHYIRLAAGYAVILNAWCED